jgi:uncharacterized protein YndB with AHSA1/START domain
VRTIDVVTETLVHQPPGRVAAFAADPDRVPEWYGNIRSVTWRTAPPLQVGSRLAFVAAFLGRRLTYTYEVREYEPGRRLVMGTADGPFPMETTYTWEPAAGGTLMRLRNRGRPRALAGLAAPVLAAAVRRANRADLARLRRLLESR